MVAAHDPARPRQILAILAGGLIAGSLDLTFALTYNNVVNGVEPVKVLYAIASGVLGREAFAGGRDVAALGATLHFVIALGAASVYYLASRVLGFLARHPLPCGVLFGVTVYLVMNFVVLPLSAAPRFRYTTASVIADLAAHMLLIGLPIAFATRHYSRLAGR